MDPSSAARGDGSFTLLHRLASKETRRLLLSCRTSEMVFTGSADMVAIDALHVYNYL